MRLNYYEFPDHIDKMTRYRNGAEDMNEGGECYKDTDCRYIDDNGNLVSCEHHIDYEECEHYIPNEVGYQVSGISVTRAKKLMKEFGGTAWTHHMERDGGVFDTTEITLKGNNSRFKYNRHL